MYFWETCDYVHDEGKKSKESGESGKSCFIIETEVEKAGKLDS